MTTMTAAATTRTSFESYLALAGKTLQKSRQSLDTRALIQLAYGDDTAHIGGSDLLVGILDCVLEKITKETVLEELKCYGASNMTTIHNIEVDERKASGEKTDDVEYATVTRATPLEFLEKIDQIIFYVINWEERRDLIEGLDAKSARESLHQNLLPVGVTMDDVMAYREHGQRLQARTALQLELERVDSEITVLQKESNEKKNKILEQLGRIEKVERELEASANVCAMVTI